MPKIFFVEDDENIRDLVIYALKTEDMESHGFEDGADFFKTLDKEAPDLVILDIMMPGEDGISILKRIRQSPKANIKKLPIIMLTAKSSEFDRVRGLDLGADDYIVKPFSMLELISRVKAILRRFVETTQSDPPFCYEEIMIDTAGHVVKVNGETIELTYKEFELLLYMTQNRGIVLSREKIMNHVWGFDYEGESRTVDMHIKKLRQKLKSAGTLIKTVRAVGYKLGK